MNMITWRAETVIRFRPIPIVAMFACVSAWPALACNDVERPDTWVWSDAEGTWVKQRGEVS